MEARMKDVTVGEEFAMFSAAGNSAVRTAILASSGMFATQEGVEKIQARVIAIGECLGRDFGEVHDTAVRESIEEEILRFVKPAVIQFPSEWEEDDE